MVFLSALWGSTKRCFHGPDRGKISLSAKKSPLIIRLQRSITALRLEAAHACRSSKSCTGRCPILPAVKWEPWGREGDNGATARI